MNCSEWFVVCHHFGKLMAKEDYWRGGVLKNNFQEKQNDRNILLAP